MNESVKSFIIKLVYWTYLPLLLLIFYKIDFSFLEKIFYNKDSEFQWGGITAIAAIIALIVSWHNSNKTIKANIISASIVKWLETAREVSSEFLHASVESMKHMNVYVKYIVSLQKNEINIDENVMSELIKKTKKIEAYRSNAEGKLILYKMLFGNNTENEEFLNSAEEITKNINKIIDYIERFQHNANDIKNNGDQYIETLNEMIKQVQIMINEFVKKCRFYYKTEWEKAKRVE